MTERADYLKALIRHSTQAELKMPLEWFDNTPCSKGITETRKEIKEAINYLKKDGGVKINIVRYPEYVIISMEAI